MFCNFVVAIAEINNSFRGREHLELMAQRIFFGKINCDVCYFISLTSITKARNQTRIQMKQKVFFRFFLISFLTWRFFLPFVFPLSTRFEIYQAAFHIYTFWWQLSACALLKPKREKVQVYYTNLNVFK